MRRRDFIGGWAAVPSRQTGARAEISTKRPLIAVLTALTKGKFAAVSMLSYRA